MREMQKVLRFKVWLNGLMERIKVTDTIFYFKHQVTAQVVNFLLSNRYAIQHNCPHP